MCCGRKRGRVTDGARTHNRWSHNPELCLLSYGHHGFGSVSIAEAYRVVNSIFALFVVLSIRVILDQVMGNGSIATFFLDNSTILWYHVSQHFCFQWRRSLLFLRLPV